jgi:hypothetical protein
MLMPSPPLSSKNFQPELHSTVDCDIKCERTTKLLGLSFEHKKLFFSLQQKILKDTSSPEEIS